MMIPNNQFHIVTCISNPINWKSRIALARESITSWVNSGANVTLVECTYGDRPYQLLDLKKIGVNHIPVRAQTLAWNKESLLNIGISRLDHSVKYIGTFDADIQFRKPNWVQDILHAMQVYPVIQPWSDAYDLGPNDEHIQAHKSFCSVYHSDQPVVAKSAKWWKFNDGPYHYPHSGFAWVWVRDFLDWVGGLFEFGGMGSGDHHMALGLVGEAKYSMPGGTDSTYQNKVYQWQERAKYINKKLGFCWGTIEHGFHGSKIDRKYVDRWGMFVKHKFNPDVDLKKNTYGVIEFAGNKPELEREFDRYLRERREDINSL